MKTNLRRTGRAAYSLVEVTVAASLVMVGIAAACTLTLAMISQEEGNVRAARALNYFENAMNLYQLGIHPDDIEALLPVDKSVVNLTITPNATAIAGIGTPDRVDMQLEFTTSVNTMIDENGDEVLVNWSAETWTGGADGTTNNRVTPVMSVYRTSVRAAGS